MIHGTNSGVGDSAGVGAGNRTDTTHPAHTDDVTLRDGGGGGDVICCRVGQERKEPDRPGWETMMIRNAIRENVGRLPYSGDGASLYK
mgnify:CR=1 FL=1